MKKHFLSKYIFPSVVALLFCVFAVSAYAVTVDDLSKELGLLETKARATQADISKARENPNTTSQQLDVLQTSVSAISVRAQELRDFLVTAPSAPRVDASAGGFCGGIVNLSYAVPTSGTVLRYELSRNPDASQNKQWGIIYQGTDLSGFPKTDNGAVPDTSYSYQLLAIGPGEVEAYSAIVQAESSETCPPPPVESSFVITEHLLHLAGSKTPVDCLVPNTNGLCKSTSLSFTAPKEEETFGPKQLFTLTGTFSIGKWGTPGQVAIKVLYPGFSGFDSTSISKIPVWDRIAWFLGKGQTAGFAVNWMSGGDLPLAIPFTAPAEIGTHKIKVEMLWAANNGVGIVSIKGELPLTVAPNGETFYPTAVTSQACGGKIDLTWKKADTTKWAGYRVYRFLKDPLDGTDGYQTIVIKDINQTSYTDTAPSVDTRYWYVIETLTAGQVSTKENANQMAGVLLAQSAPSRGFSGSQIFGLPGNATPNDYSAVSSSVCKEPPPPPPVVLSPDLTPAPNTPAISEGETGASYVNENDKKTYFVPGKKVKIGGLVINQGEGSVPANKTFNIRFQKSESE
ncbi:MAG: hypothetical protein NUV54_01685, partial [Candidatus Taylorbacteria bacterium]|nr:hypothetical protein [Candidatus Taylorbacteria bacterium]